MPFPDERDRNIIRRAEQVENLATDLCDWLSEYNPARRRTELLPVNESDEFEVLQLRRLAGSLYTSSKVPVAAAAYGASQVGKSLFMGQVLRPQSENYCPIGGDETLGEPAYYKNLSFDNDLNPQCGSQEATALVTRFTTKDRIGAGVSPQYPVMVRALTRAEWLRVLARGFHAECKTPATTWQQAELETLFEDLAQQVSRPAGRSQVADGHPRRLLLHAGGRSPRLPGHRGGDQRPVEPLPALRRRLRGGRGGACSGTTGPRLTALFVKIANFLKRITLGNHDPAIFCHWAGVRFLLDSQRSKVYERPNSKIWNHVAWNDIYLTPKEKYFVLEYRPNSGMGNEELETIQAGMLELVMPVLPHRLSEEWRKVIEQMDFLDVPGMRAVRTGIEQGKRTSADSLEEQMEIVKRGKVSYLFERFVDELQIQTLFLLLRGGNLEVKAQMKYHVEKWGRARYGEKVWPLRVQDEHSRLVHRHVGPGRGVPQPRNLRREDPLRHAAEFDPRHAGQRAHRFRRQGQAVHQRLSHPLSRHVGHQRGAAQGREPGEMGPRPQGVPRIGAGEDLRPRPGPPLGHGHEGRRRRAIADQHGHPRRDQRRRQAGPVDQGDRRRPEPALAAFARLGRRSRHEHRPRAPRDGGQEGRRLAHGRRGADLPSRARPGGVALHGRGRGIADRRLCRQRQPPPRRPAAQGVEELPARMGHRGRAQALGDLLQQPPATASRGSIPTT